VAQRNLARIAAGLFLGALVLSSGSARADERTEARSHFKKGMAEIADGRYEVGIDELKKAYDILPHPNVLYNIARAYVDQGDLENAVAYYK
jgi:tetratricopeptide (TPR) repeat protein